MSSPRVRFAPSPTGYLHVGGARTALFNWLFARRYGGVFVLRIEDTDLERSSDEMVGGILDGLRWLGLDWDEGPGIGGPYVPYLQSERLDRHRAMAERLVAQGDAYYCYCTAETLKAKRDAGEQAGSAWRYDRTCSALTADAIASRERDRIPRVIRFRVPPGTTRFDDLVHGPIEFDAANIEDFVHPPLGRSADLSPLGRVRRCRDEDHACGAGRRSHLEHAEAAAAVSRARRRRAEVCARAADPRTRQEALEQAARRDVGHRVRAPRIPAGSDGAIFLRCSAGRPGDDQEVFTREQLVAAFALEGISGGNAVFNQDKLDWFNQQHIVRLAPDELAVRVKPLARGRRPVARGLSRRSPRLVFRRARAAAPRAKRLADFAEQGALFFTDAVEYDPAAVDKHLRAPGTAELLDAIGAALAGLDAFDSASTEATIRDLADARGVKASVLIHAVRVAVTGKTASPGLFDAAVAAGSGSGVRAICGRAQAAA